MVVIVLIKKIHHLKDEQLEIINVGVDVKELDVKKSKEELRKEFKIPEDQFVMVSVGRHVPRKKFDLVIKAVYVL